MTPTSEDMSQARRNGDPFPTGVPDPAATPLKLNQLGPNRYALGETPLDCHACGWGYFEYRRGVLDTRGASFLGMTWANRGSTELLCGRCGYIMAFADA